MIKVKKEQIDAIFEDARSPEDAVVNLYKIAYPDFHKIAKIDDFPKCGREMSEYIFEKFIDQWGAAFIWMNKGFSSTDHFQWGIDVEGVPVEYLEN